MPSTEGSAPGSGAVRGARVDRDTPLLRELDGLRIQDLRAGLGHLLRFFVRQRADAPRLRHNARIGGVDAIHVRADLAVLRVQRGRHRDRRRIAAAAPQRRHLAAVRHTLVSRDDDDLSASELVLHAERPHLDDARIDVPVVGDDARLAAGEADRIAAQLADRDGQQRHRDALARREQHVELAPFGVRGDLLGHREQIVGRVAHRRHDDDDIVALLARSHDALRHLPQLFHIGDAAAAVFLHDDGHIQLGSPNADVRPRRCRPDSIISQIAMPLSALELPAHYALTRAQFVFSLLSLVGACVALGTLGVRIFMRLELWQWWVPLAFAGGMAAADIASGLIHWGADTWGRDDLPVIGHRLLVPFRVHHLNPDDLLRRPFIDANGDPAFLVLPVLLGLFAVPIEAVWEGPSRSSVSRSAAWG